MNSLLFIFAAPLLLIIVAPAASAQTSPLTKSLLSGLGVNGTTCPFDSSFGKSAILGQLGIQYTTNVTNGCHTCFIHGIGFGILMQKLMNQKVQQEMKIHGIQTLTPQQQQRLMILEKAPFCNTTTTAGVK